MKRNIVLALVAAITISMVAAGAAFAQGPGPGGNGASTGTNVNMEVTLSNYMPSAIAEVLGLSVDEVDAQLASGETFYTIALAQGYTDDQLPVLMTSVREKAVALATAAGVDQSSFLLSNQYGGNAYGNGAGTANMYSTGDETGTCICDGTCIPQNNAISMNNTYSYMYETGNGTGSGICDGTCVLQNLSQATGGSMQRQGGRR